MRAVAYTRVSTDEQSPRGQLEEVLRYARQRGYEVVRVFEENISGAVDPFERPVFRQMLEYISGNGVDVVVMYDLTRFYRAPSPVDALNKLRRLVEEYNVLVDFAREPVIEDPMFRELWMFIKSWFASYERLQASLRTRYGMMRVKSEGKLYHRPSLAHYYAAWLFNKDVGEVTEGEVEEARRRLVDLVFAHGGPGRRCIAHLAQHELKGMYERFPHAPRSYHALRRLLLGDPRARIRLMLRRATSYLEGASGRRS